MVRGWRETSHHALFWAWSETLHRQSHLSSWGNVGPPGWIPSPEFGVWPPIGLCHKSSGPHVFYCWCPRCPCTGVTACLRGPKGGPCSLSHVHVYLFQQEPVTLRLFVVLPPAADLWKCPLLWIWGVLCSRCHSIDVQIVSKAWFQHKLTPESRCL